jgi:hypothetical protein
VQTASRNQQITEGQCICDESMLQNYNVFRVCRISSVNELVSMGGQVTLKQGQVENELVNMGGQVYLKQGHGLG